MSLTVEKFRFGALIAVISTLFFGCAACSGGLKVNLLPIDIERRILLKDGTASRHYQLFTSVQYLRSIDSDQMKALWLVASEEAKKRGYCPNGFDFMSQKPGYAEGGGGIFISMVCR